MNQVNPKALLHSKWTKVDVRNKEKHFAVIDVTFDENQRVTECIIEAVISGNEYSINWRDLKSPSNWKIGWQ
ncbi:TIGR02450 family Trp-rich protein [Thalassotalea sp. PLHSN55]|uniref:TIGR02450 family Trp-rich protein n=1 Tax=Thalassotalea sp. PLHSN55 TaxID=3435888 RepID=UPI003F852A1B